MCYSYKESLLEVSHLSRFQSHFQSYLSEKTPSLEFDEKIARKFLELIQQFNEANLEEGNMECYSILKTIVEGIVQFSLKIDPNIFIQFGFLDTLLEFFVFPSIGTYNLSLTALEYLTKIQKLSDYIIHHFYETQNNFINICGEKISNTPDLKSTKQLFNIMSNTLNSFFTLHDEAEIYFDQICETSALESLLKFISKCLEFNDDIKIPEKYQTILLDISEIVEFNEETFCFYFRSFLFLIRNDLSNNCFILDSKSREISLFFQVFKNFDIDDYVNNEKVMEPLLYYISKTYSIGKLYNNQFVLLLYENINLDFLMQIFVLSNINKIREKALICVYDILCLECLNKYIQPFLQEIDNFQWFSRVLDDGTYDERLLSFLILCLFILYMPNDVLLDFYKNSQILLLMVNFVGDEPSKVCAVLLNAYNLYKANGYGGEIVSLIKDLGFIDEIENVINNNHKKESILVVMLERIKTIIQQEESKDE
ncbi:hypothetical protein TRFO_10771 [Tritrichomonas foetus]|uniref:Uncharacterized protein n=1 Tax=Tritrichomonas foetus TaxID=1144522 RepID=A0A1J4J849_9EUKA|nr:hypothetical protein TRFO_10771 [Tritrichomonas foetus]|eukprot:OHS94857.1 hypothetical protein TRFO_10771 [Tritrichomonas foetus]